MERVCQLTYKIYREILCIARNERMSYITIAGLDHVVGTFSETGNRIGLSWELLTWISGRTNQIPCSFTNFITTPDLSGPFHVSTDVYHTQITEYGHWRQMLSVSSFFSASHIFLTAILLDSLAVTHWKECHTLTFT